jgi:gamma-glutamyltranspeptidase/glutathione hydrolase
MHVSTLALALVLLASCQRDPPPKPGPEDGPRVAAIARDAGVTADAAIVAPVYREGDPTNVELSVTGKGKTFMIVSEAVDATNIGRQILAGGGNAVDAAVATAFALAVVHPTAGNIGGGGFAVVRVPSQKPLALDFRETAPAAATETMYLDDKGNATKDSLVGWRASGTPGSVAGLYELHKKLGKKSWAEVVHPAVVLAKNGFKVDAGTAQSIQMRSALLLQFPETARIWLPKQVAVTEGQTVAIPQLAIVLERIRDRGPDGFYKGETAKAIADAMKANNGTITEADLAAYKAVWRDPLTFTYRGHKVVSMPPPSSGGIVLAMTAGMLRQTELGKLAWHGTEHVHWLVETWRRAFAARNEVMGDPDFVKDMPIAKLLSPAALDAMAKSIGAGATPSKDIAPIAEGKHTTNLCVVDKDGMAVALTTTLNTAWGSGVTIHGFLMNNEMDDFATKPGTANVFGLVQSAKNKIEPGKRMLSSMSPTFVENDKGELVMVVGAQGGPRIISAVWQTLSNVIDFARPADAAVALPRIHHQHLPDVVFVEPKSLAKPAADELEKAGYKLDWRPSAREFGAANAIVRTASGWDGAADPRGGGAAMGDF